MISSKHIHVNERVMYENYILGMFDELTANDFECDNKVTAEIYKEIKL